MDPEAITRYIAETFDGVDILVASREAGSPEIAWGDTFFIYDSERNPHRIPLATIVTKDYGNFDCASNLNRPGVFRLNIGVSPETYRSLFKQQPSAIEAMGESDTGYDFTILDHLMPHPVYASQSWVCVLNPSETTFQEVVRPLLTEAYDLAARRYRQHEIRRP